MSKLKKSQPTHYFYILRCADGTLYSGQTTDLKRRLTEHNTIKYKSAKYTWSRRPVTLVYMEKCMSLSAAMRREAEVKRWTKAEKEKLIQVAIRKQELYSK